MKRMKGGVLFLGLTILLAACSTTPEEGDGSNSPAMSASLQNECVQIADRSERQACLDQAAFGGN